MKNHPLIKKILTVLSLGLLASWAGCGIYSFNGASIDPAAKTVNVHFIENRAAIVNPILSQKLTEKLRSKIVSQTRLTQTNSEEADYVFSGYVSDYGVSYAAVTNIEKPAASRLTITVNISFKSKINEKSNFEQSFSRSADFPASQNIDQVANQLIETINQQLVDDIFNRAFVNW